MFIVKRLPVLVLTAGLAVLAGCGTTPAGQPGAPAASASASGTPFPRGSSTPAPSRTNTPAPGNSTSAPPPGTAAQSRACPQPGTYLTAIRTDQHAGFDRVVFEFSGSHLPAYDVAQVKTVYNDPKGDVVPLAGQALLRVVFHGATARCPQPVRMTYAGPSVRTPFYPRLLVVSAAGDFEQVLSFGIGLAAPGSYHAYTLTGPDRVVLDVSHVALGKFPGIWDITSWQQYWEAQYSWLNGHQPWLSSPAMVVEAWARSQWNTAPVVRQVNADTFLVTEPNGRIDTVTGTRPVPVPGPWVITRITYGAAPHTSS
jgi:hypothetical protein